MVISYAHASEHKRDVAALADLLVAQGIEVVFDQWMGEERRQLDNWFLHEVRRSDYVLAIASERYKLAADGDASSDEMRGAQSETLHLRDLLQGDRSTWEPRILPVVLPGQDVAQIPAFLHPYILTRYRLQSIDAEGAKDLLTVLTAPRSKLEQQKAPSTDPGGTPPHLPPSSVKHRLGRRRVMRRSRGGQLSPPRKVRSVLVPRRTVTAGGALAIAGLVVAKVAGPLLAENGERLRDTVTGTKPFVISARQDYGGTPDDPLACALKRVLPASAAVPAKSSEALAWCKEEGGIPVSTHVVDLFFQANNGHTLYITDAKVISDVDRVWDGTLVTAAPLGGFGDNPQVAIDLDVPDPVLVGIDDPSDRPFFREHPLELRDGRSASIEIRATTTMAYVRWAIEFSIRVDGQFQTHTVPDGDQVFEVTGRSPEYKATYAPNREGRIVRVTP